MESMGETCENSLVTEMVPARTGVCNARDRLFCSVPVLSGSWWYLMEIDLTVMSCG